MDAQKYSQIGGRRKADNTFLLVCGTIGEKVLYGTKAVGIKVAERALGDARKHKDRVNKNAHKSNMEAFGAIIGEYKGKRTKWTAPWSSVQFLLLSKLT